MTTLFRIGFLLYPQVTPLDVVGPAQVFANLDAASVHLIWKTAEPVPTDAGFCIVPTDTLGSSPDLDLVCVPGGPGQQRLMQDAEVLGWLARQGSRASWVTSVCSGSLLLGAAGLLQGFRAASHWNYRQHLPMFGAAIDDARVVTDRNRITGGGVTAGIDLALEVVAMLRGPIEAQDIQLLLEYAPRPPYDCGRPESVSPEMVDRVRRRLAATVERVEKSLQ